MAVRRLAYFAVILTTMLVLGLAGNASASCQSHTILNLGTGTYTYCTTCCYGGQCSTTCY